MKGLTVEHLTDFGDFTRGKDLCDFLKQCYANVPNKKCMSDIRISPDGHHIHAIIRKPKTRLVTFDKCQRLPLIQSQRPLDSGLARTVSLSELVYLDRRGRDGGSAVLAVVFENGRTEFWRYCVRKGGWDFLHTSDLCNSPRAKVVSVCACANFIVWCEERPPSETTSAGNATPDNYRHCICKRTYEVEEGGVCLGGVKIALHNNPRYRVIASGDNVYLLPEAKQSGLAGVAKVFLCWSPQTGAIAVNSACGGALWRKPSPACKEADFRELMWECVGLLAAIRPPEICAFAPSSCGGLLLLLDSGWVSWLQGDGVLRKVYRLADNCVASRGVHRSVGVHGDVLLLAAGRTLYVIDGGCGRELERVALKREGVLFAHRQEQRAPHLLSDAGLFVIRPGEPPARCERLQPGAALVEAVFEEACRYYQQRSLSSTQLTVEKLKSGGMFQAPVALSSILDDYLSGQKAGNLASESGGYAKLLVSLEEELKSLVTLEEVKTAVVAASERELEGHCESLVQKEVGRLLSSGDADRESVLYLNGIFGTFPSQAWLSLRSVLQLRRSCDGSLCSTAPPEVWRTALSPVQATAPDRWPPQPRPDPANAVVPVFELICRSLLRFQPGWLPKFVELAQRQAGAPSWSYGVKESADSLPLYKRALSVLPENGESRDLEVELLLCSQRPNAVMQALRVLIGQRQWGWVTRVAERFCRQSPLLNKEIFSALLREVTQHRDLDPYLDLLWTLSPEDLTVTSILNMVLQDLPSSPPGAAPFPGLRGPLTVGLLKPLLSRVLLRETRPSQRYTDILRSPSYPPPTPPRQAKGMPRATTHPAMDLQGRAQSTASGTGVMSPPPHL